MLRLLSGVPLLCAILCGAACAGQNSKPNILIVLCDDLGYGDLGCYGHATIKTPNLDKFAAQGMKLSDCYSSAPVCSPSRAGLLTGRTPYRCGIYDWIPLGSPVHLKKEEVTVAALLKKAGYATCHVGKWHCNGAFNSAEQPQPGDHGFDHWFSTQNNAAPSHHNPVNFVRNGTPTGDLKGYSSTLIVDEAIAWLGARNAAQPFCLFVWFHSPHEPVATSEQFAKMYADADPPERANYYGNVTQMDAEFGRLMKALDDKKLRESTFTLFTSDNGPETLLGYKAARSSYGSPGPLRGMKLHLYEGGIRVPGILCWPGTIKGGQLSREPVCNTDFLPTLCELAGVPVPAGRAIDGASLLPLLAGNPILRKTPLYWQYDRARGLPKVAMREGDWKILAHRGLSKFELYNLKDDVKEANDLAEKEPERLKSMSAALTKMHASVQAERPVWPVEIKAGKVK